MSAERTMVSLVVVHGIGAQRKTQTLLEWAEPLLRRIDWISQTTGGDGVQFGRVALGEEVHDSVSVRAQYAGLDDELRETYLTVTEARWSQAFLALGAGEVFQWGATFVWRAALRVGAQLSRVLWVNPWWRPLSSFAVAALWLSLLVVSLAATTLLPVAAVLLVVPGISTLLTAASAGLVEFIGDVAVWTRRPVRAAAMRAVVRDEIVDARGRLDTAASEAGIPPHHTRLVVLAFSQGASIAAETLFSSFTGEPRPRIDAFVTLGAPVALLGSPRWTTARFPWLRAMVAGAGALARKFDPVRDWMLLPTPPRWLNVWALWDPFGAGPLSTSNAGRAQRWRELYRAPRVTDEAPGPAELPVHNTAWPFTDHQSYVQNVAQVIDPVARLLLGIEEPVAARASGRSRAHALAVRGLGVNRLAILALAVFLVPVLDLTALAAWAVAVAAAVTLLWVNGVLWRSWLARADWSTVPPRQWIAGAVLRVAVIGAWDIAATTWGVPVVVPVVVGVVAVAAPWLGRLPRELGERRN